MNFYVGGNCVSSDSTLYFTTSSQIQLNIRVCVAVRSSVKDYLESKITHANYYSKYKLFYHQTDHSWMICVA